VLLEYELPLTSKRLDCLILVETICQRSSSNYRIEAWEKCEEGDAERIVTFVGGNNRDFFTLGSSGQYRAISRLSARFYEGEFPSVCEPVHTCIITHRKTATLVRSTIRAIYQECPLFTGDDVAKLTGYLREFWSKAIPTRAPPDSRR